jgi:rhamnogalacturonyl hydrolase YesR
MKAFAAALIAVGILYTVDSGYNDGRYSAIVERAITGLVTR